MNSPKRSNFGDVLKGCKRPRLENGNIENGHGSKVPKVFHDHENHSPERYKDKEAGIGIIEKITLTNFMCHSKLEVDFGPNINFINGNNGSGKSAILTGLVVCLGGRASTTNRGASLKDFIQSGETSFNVEVRLRNQGEDAYKPSEYGSTICVEKRFTKEGARVLRLRSEDGRVISNKKDELLAILDQFNIQIDNPISVLTQNTSRNFLSSKKPEDLYSFFMRATLLDQMRRFNVEASEKLHIAVDILSRKRESLPQLKREVEDWKHQWQLHRGLKNQKEKVRRLKAEYVWALVIEKEEEAQRLLEALQKEMEANKKLREQVQVIKERIWAKNEQYSNTNNSLRAAAKDLKVLMLEKTEANTALNENKALVRNTVLLKRKYERDVVSAEEDITSLKRRIDDMSKSYSQDMGSASKKRKLQINEQETEKSHLIDRLQTLVTKRNQIIDSIRLSRDILDQTVLEEKSTESQIASAERNLKHFESCRKNDSQRFGFYIPALLQQIEAAHRMGRFRKKPLGPIGMHITLRDPKWSLAVESCLGRLLEAFCSDNHQDEQVLRQLMNKTIRQSSKPAIIVSAFQNNVYHVQKHAVRFPPYSTILDMLIVDNPPVANCLIDQRSIESILLIENKEEARRVMTHHVPKNCIQTFTIEGDQVYPAPSFRYYTNHQRTSKCLQGSAEGNVDEFQRILIQLRTVLKENKQSVKEKEVALKALQHDLTRVDAEEKNTHQRISKLKSQLSKLLNVSESGPVDVEYMEAEVSALETNLPKLCFQLEQSQNILKEAENKLKALRSNIAEIDNKIINHNENAEPLEEQMSSLQGQISNLNRESQCLESKLNDHQRKVQLLKKNWDEVNIEAKEMENKCKPICDRIITRRSSENLSLEIQKTESSLNLIESQQLKPGDISERFLETKRRYEKVKADINECDEIVHKIEAGIKSRQLGFVEFRTSLAVRIKYSFNTYLHSRNFKGAIQFDHKNSSLKLEVQTYQFAKRMCKDIRSLSGGERSFSTICLILSLWENMESPFRFLDEYDVFMDMVNRRNSMDMMIKEANNKRQNQFIFLTPLDLTRIRDSELITIFRMPDPKRTVDRDVEED